MKNKKCPPKKNRQKKSKSIYVFLVCTIATTLYFSPVALAAGSPLDSINKLSDFVFAAIRAIGVILLGFGILQLGLSVKSHDASQRANGFLVIFGGIIIIFAKEILDMIV